jgi:hypothetical protein
MTTTILTHASGGQTVLTWETWELAIAYASKNKGKDIHIRPTQVAAEIKPEKRAYGFRLAWNEVIDVRVAGEGEIYPKAALVKTHRNGRWQRDEVEVPVYRQKGRAKGLYIFWGGEKLYLGDREWIMLKK